MARTLTKQNQNEWAVPPSPRSLVVKYDYAKVEYLALKTDIMELFKRLIPHCNMDFISQVILQEGPLLKVYDLYLEANKKMSIPIIILSDSTTSASVGMVVANGGVNGDEDDDDATAATQAN
ncbi:hypothetical protein ACS0TY_011094 [Phlomoides rotata]